MYKKTMKIKIFNKENIKSKNYTEIKNTIKDFLKANIEINIIIMSKISIKNINKKYRKKNNETDILTFKTNLQNNTIVDIILCPEIIEKKHKLDFKKILIHGLLHIIKYEHNKIKENKIMEKTQKIIGMSGIEPPTITTSK